MPLNWQILNSNKDICQEVGALCNKEFINKRCHMQTGFTMRNCQWAAGFTRAGRRSILKWTPPNRLSQLPWSKDTRLVPGPFKNFRSSLHWGSTTHHDRNWPSEDPLLEWKTSQLYVYIHSTSHGLQHQEANGTYQSTQKEQTYLILALSAPKITLTMESNCLCVF